MGGSAQKRLLGFLSRAEGPEALPAPWPLLSAAFCLLTRRRAASCERSASSSSAAAAGGSLRFCADADTDVGAEAFLFAARLAVAAEGAGLAVLLVTLCSLPLRAADDGGSGFAACFVGLLAPAAAAEGRCRCWCCDCFLMSSDSDSVSLPASSWPFFCFCSTT